MQGFSEVKDLTTPVIILNFVTIIQGQREGGKKANCSRLYARISRSKGPYDSRYNPQFCYDNSGSPRGGQEGKLLKDSRSKGPLNVMNSIFNRESKYALVF